jgi:hypothetical protein
MSALPNAVTWFLPLVPGVIVWGVGAIIAVFTWRRHPRVSLLALLACLLVLFNYVVGGLAQYWLILESGSGSARQVELWLGLLNLVRTALSVTSAILILCAVFTGRAPTYQPPPVDVSLRTPPREPAPADRPRDSDDIQKGPHWS